jgi:hypothetical protein
MTDEELRAAIKERLRTHKLEHITIRLLADLGYFLEAVMRLFKGKDE